MSQRERWIVYPLLFLALGTALRDKFYPPHELAAENIRCQNLLVQNVRAHELAVDSTRCQELVVATAAGQERARLDTAPSTSAGRLLLFDPDGKPVVFAGTATTDNAPTVELLRPDGKPQLLIAVSNFGGRLVSFDRQGAVLIELGFEEGRSGLTAADLMSGHALPWINTIQGLRVVRRGQPAVAPPANEPRPEEPSRDDETPSEERSGGPSAEFSGDDEPSASEAPQDTSQSPQETSDAPPRDS
jgi:hypothetical protein